MQHIAPVQGHTDAAWRHFHHEIYGGYNRYYTPFIRLEKGDFRRHDLKDWQSELNDGMNLTPQVIFKNSDELATLVSGLVERGATAIDLNSGCPFPLQTARGRGAAFVGNVEEYAKLPELLGQYPDTRFSLKMRLGYADPEEWRNVIAILNEMPLTHATLHPRIARQQYSGELYMDQFDEFLASSRHPVVFNGDINTPEDINRVISERPAIAGVMTGRGILGRPSLLAEYESQQEWDKPTRIRKMLDFHNRMFAHYQETLCGDHQVLSKIKPFWEYAEAEIGRKAWKALGKASNFAKYRTALTLIEQE